MRKSGHTHTFDLTVLTTDHPLYVNVIAQLGDGVYRELERRVNRLAGTVEEADLQSVSGIAAWLQERELSGKELRFSDVDWARVAADYNQMAIGEVLAFITYSVSKPWHIRSSFERRGLVMDRDLILRLAPVASIEAMVSVGEFPVNEDIAPEEFDHYARFHGRLYPDTGQHPTLAMIDSVLPRRGNRFYTADTIPVMAHLWQVYVVKTSTRQMGEGSRPGPAPGTVKKPEKKEPGKRGRRW